MRAAENQYFLVLEQFVNAQGDRASLFVRPESVDTVTEKTLPTVTAEHCQITVNGIAFFVIGSAKSVLELLNVHR